MVQSTNAGKCAQEAVHGWERAVEEFDRTVPGGQVIQLSTQSTTVSCLHSLDNCRQGPHIVSCTRV